VEEEGAVPGVPEPERRRIRQRQFFDYAGPLHTVVDFASAST